MLTPQVSKPKSRYWQVFFLCLAVSAALFLPHCIVDAMEGGFFHYAGDFNDQQISFYNYANRFLKGGGSFSWATDLGSGFVNAYSFYLVGSPFFWLTMLLPAKLTPWFMVPMLCLKFALAGGGGYLWVRRWTGEGRWAMVGGCLYAFSGFGIYNVFFNHFLDVVALFPYLLASLDDAMIDGKRGQFPFWVAINLLNSYFFFAGQAVFLVIYFVCMCLGHKYRLTRPLFGRMAFETLIGCACGCLLLIPAMLSLVQNPRTIDPFDGYGYLVYGEAQQYLAILYSAFLVPDAPYLQDMFDSGILNWTSLTAYLPVVGIVGGLAFCRAKPGHAFTRILKVCVLCAFVPVLNSAFYALNSSYYARWYYMPLLVLCGATVLALKNARLVQSELPRALKLAALVTLSSIAFALVPNSDSSTDLPFGVVDNQARFWGIFAVSMLGVVLCTWLLHYGRKAPRRFAGATLAVVLGFSFVYGTVHLSITKYGQWNHDSSFVQQTYGEADELNAALPDDGFYRLDAYQSYNNMGLWLNKSCIQFFNSTVAPHILEFYPTVGVKRDVNSKPKVELYALRGLLSVRYTLVPIEKENEWLEEKQQGWTYLRQAGSYAIYENDNWVPMGFTYQYYTTAEQFEKVAQTERGNLLMKALLLDEDQIERYGDVLQPLPEAETTNCNADAYVADCAARRESGVTEFTATTSGFTAEADLEQSTLVFFSVPYDDGFTATVNGRDAAVEKVDNGLMAVLAPAGHSTIAFTYHTPGLALAAKITLGGLLVYAVYGAVLWRMRRRKAGAPQPTGTQEQKAVDAPAPNETVLDPAPNQPETEQKKEDHKE